MVRVSSPAKLRPWSELTAQNGDGGGSCVGDKEKSTEITITHKRMTEPNFIIFELFSVIPVL